mgnify:CR=1 FL=1
MYINNQILEISGELGEPLEKAFLYALELCEENIRSYKIQDNKFYVGWSAIAFDGWIVCDQDPVKSIFERIMFFLDRQIINGSSDEGIFTKGFLLKILNASTGAILSIEPFTNFSINRTEEYKEKGK